MLGKGHSPMMEEVVHLAGYSCLIVFPILHVVYHLCLSRRKGATFICCEVVEIMLYSKVVRVDPYQSIGKIKGSLWICMIELLVNFALSNHWFVEVCVWMISSIFP